MYNNFHALLFFYDSGICRNNRIKFFCCLSKNTAKNIELRARLDSMVSSNTDTNDINCDYDDDEDTFIDLKDYTFDIDKEK